MANKLRSKDFKNIGINSNQLISIAMSILKKKKFKKYTIEMKLELIQKVKKSPEEYLDDDILTVLAREFYEPTSIIEEEIKLHDEEIELNVFGRPLIKSNAYLQMKQAMKLPVVTGGALMPDSHLGYGLPIGAALATTYEVIPYAIGMDIGCRMSLNLYDVTERFFKMHEHKFKQSILDNTAFGLSKVINISQEHPFLCLLYTSPSPRDRTRSRMPSSA